MGTNNVFTDTNGDTAVTYYTKRGEQTAQVAEGVAVNVINSNTFDNLDTTDKTIVGAINEKADAIPDGTYTNYGIWGDLYVAAGRMFVPFPNADDYTFTVTEAKYVSDSSTMTDITATTTYTLANKLGVLFATTTSAACTHYGTITFTATKN